MKYIPLRGTGVSVQCSGVNTYLRVVPSSITLMSGRLILCDFNTSNPPSLKCMGLSKGYTSNELLSINMQSSVMYLQPFNARYDTRVVLPVVDGARNMYATPFFSTAAPCNANTSSSKNVLFVTI